MIEVGSDFSGVGSFIQALQRLEIEHKATNCECGAWQISKNGEVFQVADCCCC